MLEDVKVAVASTYTYDLVDELTDVTNTTAGNPSTSLLYRYDANGNRTSDSVTSNYSIDNVNEITNTGYTHDLAGNMTNDGVHGFEWDAANRLIAIVHPGTDGRTEFTYDGLGRRVKIVEKDGDGTVLRTGNFVWDGMTIAEERDKYNTVVKRFLPEGMQIPANTSPNSKLYYSRDHLGSVRSLTNENGTLLSTLDYDPYGSISRAPVPANTTSGGPVITAAESQLTHAGVGMFPVSLPLSGAPGIEPRSNGGNYTLVLTFDRPVVLGTATIASGVGTVGALPSFSGNTATVQLSGVADRQTITVELDNVVGVTGLTDKVFVAMSVVIGDVNQNGVVTVDDITLIRAANLTAPTTPTFTRDVNISGRIDSNDVFTARSNQGSFFPDFAFTGHYYHARSCLYLAPYRAYNPSIGRWLSRDPIGEKGGLNLFAYVSNDPVDRIDPLGLRAWRCRKPLHAFPGTGQRTGPDITGNPLYHEYYCVGTIGGGVRCYGQDRAGGAWPWEPGKPSDDTFLPQNCEAIPSDDCFERCLESKGHQQRPRYGLCGPGTNCQEWAEAAIADCRKQCKKQCDAH